MFRKLALGLIAAGSLGVAALAPTAASAGGFHHHHHGHDADEVFDEIGAETSSKFTRAELEAIIDSLDECGEVLRAKGLVENSDGGWLEFDYVPGEGEIRDTSAEAHGMIAVIGTRLNKDKIKEMFKLS